MFKPFTFADSSHRRLKDAHYDLKLIIEEAKKLCMIDFDISCVYRTDEEQTQLFKDGLSDINGLMTRSKHQLKPSKALDIYAYKPGKPQASYSLSQMSFIAGVIQSTAIRLYGQGLIKHTIRWGGNWDMDGEIITDQSFQDLCHFELFG